ncbi:MAG: cupin domain-containing protein [Planctomycetota bacterium]|jgi:quercetin dioxygenase-like cupin family protein
MERTRKTWGEKSNIFQNNLSEVSVLYLKPWQRCSWHRHLQKYNLFYVLKGKLVLKLEDGESEVLPGQIFTTVPGEYHEFQTRDLDTVIIEVMYVQYDANDIQRDLLGGPIQRPEKILYDLVCTECNKGFSKKIYPEKMGDLEMICDRCSDAR